MEARFDNRDGQSRILCARVMPVANTINIALSDSFCGIQATKSSCGAAFMRRKSQRRRAICDGLYLRG